VPTPSPIADAVISRLAARQYGVVARRQLLALGVSGRQIDLRERRGLLHRQYRGVYAVGHEQLRPEGRRLAAVLACGPDAVLSHRSASTHWRVRAYALSKIEVTVPRGHNGRVAGIRIRRRRLAAADVTVHDGVPVTTVARTLLDLASEARGNELAGAVDEAHRLGLYDQKAVDAQLGQGRAGTAAFRALLAERHPERERAKSTLETLGIDLFGASGLPRPEINVWFPALGDDGGEVDLLWREERVVVEMDGWDFHRFRRQFEDDRRKSVELLALGYVVLRFTWRQTVERPEWVVANVRVQLEARRGATSTGKMA